MRVRGREDVKSNAGKEGGRDKRTDQTKRHRWNVKVQYNTTQCNTIQYNTIQYSTIQYSTIQYNTVQYNTIQYNTIQYNTIQCNMVSIITFLLQHTAVCSKDSVQKVFKQTVVKTKTQ